MRKLRYILEYFLNSFAAPKNYFEHIKEIRGDSSEALILILVSGGVYGLLNSSRSLIRAGLGEYATISTSQEAMSIGLSSFASGLMFFFALIIVIFVIMHLAAFGSGLRNWRNTFFVTTYSSPVVNVYILSLVIYQLFQKIVIGFPLIKYLLALLSLAFIGYVLARGLESLHEIEFKKSLLIAVSPIIVIIGIQLVIVVSFIISLMSIL